MDGEWNLQLQPAAGGDQHDDMERQVQQQVDGDLALAIGGGGGPELGLDRSMDLLWGYDHGLDDGAVFPFDGLHGAAADAGNPIVAVADSDDASHGGAVALENELTSSDSTAVAVQQEANSGGAGPSGVRRRKRHSREQIQQLQAVFNEVPHPDKKLRKDLGKKLNLTSKQIKFWFQNRRSSNKNQAGRDESKAIREENDMLRAENQAIRARIRQGTCSTCGGPVAAVPETPERRRLLLDNARLREELERATAILSLAAAGKSPATSGVLPVDLGNPSAGGSGSAGPSAAFLQQPPAALSNPALFAPEACVEGGHCAAAGNSSRAALQLHVQRAFHELKLLASNGEPMWVSTDDGDVLNCEEYARVMFPSIHGHTPPGFTVNGTRSTGIVMGMAGDIAEIFTDPIRWTGMFPGIVSAATGRKVVPTPGDSNYVHTQLMEAELRLLAPRVPVRKLKFVRQCKMLEHGVWAVVDVSVDGIIIPDVTEVGHDWNGGSPRHTPCRLLPSGFIIEDMNNGCSKVTWVVVEEYEERTVPPLYQPLVRAGESFGAHRWLASLKRQCEYLTVFHSDPGRVGNTGGVPPDGRNYVLQLAHGMVANFLAGMSGRVWQPWRNLDEWRGNHGAAGSGDSVDLAVRFAISSLAAPRDQLAAGALVLTGTATAWLPAKPPHLVFAYLSDGDRRGEWDVFADGAPVQVERYVGTGQFHGNVVSLLRTNAPGAISRNSSKMILQESRVDKSSMLMAYAPVGEQFMVNVMNGCGDPSTFLLPCGFVVLPDGYRGQPSAPQSPADVAVAAASAHAIQGDPGTFVCAVYQIILSGPPPESTADETVDHIGKLICRAMKKIKDAVNASIIVSA